jgi:nucleotide-binding universal stress UspA family protein
VLVHAAAYLRDEPVAVAERRARGLLGRARGEAERYLDASSIYAELVAAEPRQSLVELSEQAALLVLGLTGGGTVDELLLGSTTLAISGRARCPLAGVREWPLSSSTGRHDTVVLGIRQVRADQDAITLAFDLAARTGSALSAVHSIYRDPHPVGRDRAAETERERNYLAWQLRTWRHRYPAVPVSCHLGDSHPSQELLRHGDRAGAIVVGCRKRGAATRTLLGSTGRSVLRHSQVPTIVVGPSARLNSPTTTHLGAENDPHALSNLW